MILINDITNIGKCRNEVKHHVKKEIYVNRALLSSAREQTIQTPFGLTATIFS